MEYGQMMEQAKENAKLAFYQNPGYQLERRERKSFIIKANPKHTGVFNLDLHEPLVIDRLSDIYLENFTTFHGTYHHAGYATNAIDKSAFVLKIEEFNHQGNSTDSNTFNKLIIPNENTGAAAPNTRKIHKGKKLNYVASINPSTLSKISGTITDLDGGPNTMFNASDDMFLAEFVVVARD